jgi:hypothetical protein
VDELFLDHIHEHLGDLCMPRWIGMDAGPVKPDLRVFAPIALIVEFTRIKPMSTEALEHEDQIGLTGYRKLKVLLVNGDIGISKLGEVLLEAQNTGSGTRVHISGAVRILVDIPEYDLHTCGKEAGLALLEPVDGIL